MKRFGWKIAVIIIIVFGIYAFWQNNSFGRDSYILPVASITGKVIAQNTNNPLSVFIEVRDGDGSLINTVKSNSLDGYYFITGLLPGKKYSIGFMDFRYGRESYKLDIPELKEYLEINKDFVLMPKPKNLKPKQKFTSND
ncbi:MAG: hypothetical protein QG635_819 [Bacteroidota bacterium]|nr:hypothetical protein [Bacteroidota bacterium]